MKTYLVITASLHTKYGIRDYEHRLRTYIDSIVHTLKVLPKDVIPIIVENNGPRSTPLDTLGCEVLYTDNNSLQFRHKGGNELADIKDVLRHYDIQDDDLVVKLTGRYKLLSDHFFKELTEEHDAFVKYFNVCTKEFMPGQDCVLGLIALKAKHWKKFDYAYTRSPEVEMAVYTTRQCQTKSLTDLDLLCCFADDHRTLHV